MLIVPLLLVCIGCVKSPTTPASEQEQRPVNLMGWSETFGNGLSSKWMRTSSPSPHPNGTFVPQNVDTSLNVLGLKLTQHWENGLAVSEGAEIQSVERYGFGTYTWVARVSTTATTPDGPGSMTTGQTSALFLFEMGKTELDFEHEGMKLNVMHCVTWSDDDIQDHVEIKGTFDDRFHTYSIEWRSDRVVYSIDGVRVSMHTHQVPQVPAYVLMSHWGTNSQGWGGAMTPLTRWMWIRSFSYEPL